jgi:hypothetical protein
MVLLLFFQLLSNVYLFIYYFGALFPSFNLIFFFLPFLFSLSIVHFFKGFSGSWGSWVFFSFKKKKKPIGIRNDFQQDLASIGRKLLKL